MAPIDAGFSEDVAFACPPPSHPTGMIPALATPVMNYLKWQAIQLAIHSIVGNYI